MNEPVDIQQLIDAVLPFCAESSRALWADSRVQEPGITLEYMLADVAGRSVPVPADLLATLQTAATLLAWPDLAGSVAQLNEPRDANPL